MHIDGKVIERFRMGDVQAFRMIYDAHNKPLYHFAYSYLKDSFEAEEIIQDVFLKVWEKRNEIDEEKSFTSYLYRITVNKVFNELKHRVVKKKYELYALKLDPESDYTPESSIQYNELNTKIENLLSQLHEQQRRIFVMSRWKGLSNAEIAQDLSLSVRTVENQIYRASKFIKFHLKDEYPLEILLIVLSATYFC